MEGRRQSSEAQIWDPFPFSGYVQSHAMLMESDLYSRNVF